VIVNEPTYPVPQLPLDATTLTVAALTGVVLAPLALGFRTLSQRAEKIKAKDRSLLWRIPVAFVLVAVVSLWLPEILGNGRLLTQHTFNVSLDAAAGGLSAAGAGGGVGVWGGEGGESPPATSPPNTRCATPIC